MAGFEGIKWAPQQMRFTLTDKQFDLLGPDAKVSGVSRSTHYGLCLTFEGIRFFATRGVEGQLEVNFLGLPRNLERFRRGISFNLGRDQQGMVPSVEELTDVFINRFFGSPQMREFLEEMADLGAQGYLRPYTIDEDQSIGVTFPAKPSIRAVVCRYDKYLGEPFSGVAVPNLVRAVGVNGTGCLKLGINYLMSIKAIDAAKAIKPEAASALFLDDRTYLPLDERRVTEWDTSCCLFGLRDGTVVKIPESNLILPSVTIYGMTCILRHMGIPVDEREMTYGELVARSRADEIIAICSVGTAGIMNRCQELLLVDQNDQPIVSQYADPKHELYDKLGDARTYYWDIYREKVAPPRGLTLNKFAVTPSASPA
jgi:branched-chain amino acid aminotransferase